VRLQNRRVLGSAVLTALVMGAALVLAGCGAGQITQTAGQQAAINGADAQVKTLAIRDAVLQFPPNGAYPTGSDAALQLTIVNDGSNDDELVSVSSDAAAGAVILGSKTIVARSSLFVTPPTAGAPVTTSPSSSAPGVTSSSPATTTSSGSASASPTSTSTSTSPTSTSPTSTSPTSTSPSSPTSSPSVAIGTASIVLQGLKQPVWPGQTIKVTFVFRDAGTITVDVPLGTSDQPRTGDVHVEVTAPAPGH
jgi:copper(I)-binding protein